MVNYTMLFLKILFWLSLFIVFYSYLLYGVLIAMLLYFRKKKRSAEAASSPPLLPHVSLIIAAYNEEKTIQGKISNTLALDYPSEKLTIIFVTDGSTDNTNAILAGYPVIKTLYAPERKGKVAAINRAMQFVSTPITVFCDANTQLNTLCIREIVKHYARADVGAVAGEKKVIDPSIDANVAGAGEGLYWKYESFLKRLDSQFYTVVGAAGELFSIRTELFEEVPENVLLDDFIISLKIAQQGYRVVYEPAAYAVEEPSVNMQEERKRKIRIGAGGFQSIVMLKGLLNIFKYPKLSFQYISHRVLRWAVCPFLLPLLLILNCWIYYSTGQALYGILLVGQILFYCCAFIGYLLALSNKKSKIFYVPYYFVFINISLYLGLGRYFRKRQSVLWEKAARKSDQQAPQVN